MGELKLSQVVKYGAVMGIGMGIAEVMKPMTVGVTVALIRHCFPTIYKEAEERVLAKERAKES